MIILSKQAKEHPNTSLDPYVGTLQLFRQSDFYCKSRQTSKLPDEHEFDERLVEAYEFLYQIFQVKWGAKAKPRFSSTLRLPGDPNYRTKTGNLSYHSRARAADGNWNQHGQTIEDYIVCVVGYDIEQKGPIYERLRQIGIGSIGTYYREPEGTFIHLDTREGFLHFRKIKRHKKSQAKKWWEEWQQLAAVDLTASLALAPQAVEEIVIVDVPEMPPITNTASNTPSDTWEDEIIFSADVLQDVVKQASRSVYGSDEDPFSVEYLVVKWVGRVLVGLFVGYLVFVVFRWWKG